MLLSVDDAATWAGVSADTIGRALATGALRGEKIPNPHGRPRWSIDPNDLQRWAASRSPRARRRGTGRPAGPPLHWRPGPSPPTILLDALLAARRRHAPFDEAWPAAVAHALAAIDSDELERRAWSLALEETRAGWEDAYDRGAPRPGDRALARVREFDYDTEPIPTTNSGRGVLVA